MRLLDTEDRPHLHRHESFRLAGHFAGEGLGAYCVELLRTAKGVDCYCILAPLAHVVSVPDVVHIHRIPDELWASFRCLLVH